MEKGSYLIFTDISVPLAESAAGAYTVATSALKSEGTPGVSRRSTFI